MDNPLANPFDNPVAQNPFEDIQTPKFVCTKCYARCEEHKCACGTYSGYSVRRARRTVKGR